VLVANPRQTKDTQGKKTDKLDARRIYIAHRDGRLKPSVISPENNRLISEFILSFGMPIDSKVVTSNINSENSESQLQIYNEAFSMENTALSVDNNAFNLGLLSAFLLYALFMTVISFTTSYVPLIMMGIGIALIIALWYWEAISKPASPEARRGFTYGYGFGLISAGLQMISPMCPGFIIVDLSIWTFVFGLVKLGFQLRYVSEYTIDPWLTLIYNEYSIVTTYIWNQVVENDNVSYKKWAWEGFAFFNFFFGLFLIQAFNFIMKV